MAKTRRNLKRAAHKAVAVSVGRQALRIYIDGELIDGDGEYMDGELLYGDDGKAPDFLMVGQVEFLSGAVEDCLDGGLIRQHTLGAGTLTTGAEVEALCTAAGRWLAWCILDGELERMQSKTDAAALVAAWFGAELVGGYLEPVSKRGHGDAYAVIVPGARNPYKGTVATIQEGAARLAGMEVI